MRDLVELKKQVQAYNSRIESNGGKLLEYECPDCKTTLKSNVPDEEGEVWDSAVTCYECGEMHFYVKKIDSITATSMKD